MAFDSRNGFCLSGGPPAATAPYAPQTCFQTAYAPSSDIASDAFAWGGLNCQRNGATLGACSYNAECGPGAVCDAGKCWPVKNNQSTGESRYAPNMNPWAYDNSNPRVVADLSWEAVKQIMDTLGLDKEFQTIAKNFAFGKSMFIVKHKGKTHLAVPLNVQYFRQDPQCSTCLKSVWQCNRYRDQAKYDPMAAKMYAACKEYENAFFYDTMGSTGVVIPIMVKVDPVSLQVASAALQKCAMHCGDAQPNTPLALDNGSDEFRLFY